MEEVLFETVRFLESLTKAAKRERASVSLKGMPQAKPMWREAKRARWWRKR